MERQNDVDAISNNEMEQIIVTNSNFDDENPDSTENSNDEYSRRDEEAFVSSPTPSFVPDSPSTPFEFWDSSEDDDDKGKSKECMETEKDSLTKDLFKESSKALTSDNVEVEETVEVKTPQPIFIDLVSSDDEEVGNEKCNKKQLHQSHASAAVKTITAPKSIQQPTGEITSQKENL